MQLDKKVNSGLIYLICRSTFSPIQMPPDINASPPIIQIKEKKVPTDYIAETGEAVTFNEKNYM